MTPHLLSLYRRSNSNIFIFSDASRAGELLVPKSGPKSALNPDSALILYYFRRYFKIKIVPNYFYQHIIMYDAGVGREHTKDSPGVRVLYKT